MLCVCSWSTHKAFVSVPRSNCDDYPLSIEVGVPTCGFSPTLFNLHTSLRTHACTRIRPQWYSLCTYGLGLCVYTFIGCTLFCSSLVHAPVHPFIVLTSTYYVCPALWEWNSKVLCMHMASSVHLHKYSLYVRAPAVSTIHMCNSWRRVGLLLLHQTSK